MRMDMYTYVYKYVCMYACMYVCVYVKSFIGKTSFFVFTKQPVKAHSEVSKLGTNWRKKLS
jgi:hypothetical protein